MFGMLKIQRCFRIGRIIETINASIEIKVFLNLLQMFYFLILYVHIIGCIWFYICKQDESWYPPLDYMYVYTPIYHLDWFYQYTSSFYHAIVLLNGGEIGP